MPNRDLKQLNREKIESAKKGFLGFFVKRHRFVTILLIGLIIWGVFGLLSLPREANPEVKIPFAIVTTLFPGAPPTDVEELVTDKIEERIKDLDNIKEITSSSAQGASTVSVEFQAEANLDESIEEVEDTVNEITDLPDDAEEPRVQEVNFNDQSIVTVSLLGNLTDQEFKELADIVEEELEGIGGVSRIVPAGVRNQEISVRLNPGQLARFGLSIPQIISSINSANFSFPLGEIELNETKYNIRTSGNLESVNDLHNVVVRNTPDGPVLLSDIAEIESRLKERTTVSRISLASEEPLPAISFQVFKQTGANIIEIVDTVKQRLAELKNDGVIPAEVEIEYTNDFSQFIRNDINTLGLSGLQTIIFIFILLTLALNFRQGLIGALSIPVVFLMAFGFLALTDSTLNSLTLFSLVLSMGLLVDTTIVLMEGLHDGLQQGFTPKEAVLYSIETYKWPITAGVLTTISAFMPMFLVSGIVGEFLETLPKTIAITLSSSLFIGLIILPGIAAMILARLAKGKFIGEKKSVMERYLIDKISPWYETYIQNLLASRKKKVRLILALLALFVISIGTIVFGVVPTELFPKVDIDSFFINVELPVGSTLEKTSVAVEQVEMRLMDRPWLKSYVTNIGTPPINLEAGFSSGIGSENTAQITVNLLDEDERNLKSYEITPPLRDELKTIDGAEITVQELSSGPPTGAPIEVRILGEDLSMLRILSDRIKSILANIPGTVNVSSDDRTSPPEFTFTLSQEKMGRFGLNSSAVGSSLRASLTGITATTIKLDGDDVDVTVQLQNTEQLTAEELKNLDLITPSGESIKLAQIADFGISPALESVRHRDLKRIISVRSDAEKNTSASEVTEQLEEQLTEINIPEGIAIETGGEVEDIQQSFTELWYSMSVAVVLIFLIMILQFNSYRQPFIILLTLPLAVIGVTFGTFVTRLSFGFGTFLGIVALSGIVVNDAIVLIDQINYNLYTRKLKIQEAITAAGTSRLQPIIMTTLTTIAGVTPLAFVDEFWRGLSVAVAFGIAFATVLTLVAVPVLYLKLQGKRWLKEKARPDQSLWKKTEDQLEIEPL